MRRRSFLAALALLPAAAGCQTRPRAASSQSRDLPGSPLEDGCRATRRDADHPRVLTPAQWQTLDAACERILPKDGDAGAREAGVINYIDAQLAYPPIRSLLSLMQAGAQELDRLAGAHGAGRFAELSGEQQDAVLTAVQGSRMGAGSGARFFQVLLTLTLEGFFSDPVYGGNRDGVGWKMIALTPRSPGAQCVYRGLS